MEVESIRSTMQLQAEELAKAHFRVNNRRSSRYFFSDQICLILLQALHPVYLLE